LQRNSLTGSELLQTKLEEGFVAEMVTETGCRYS
jgi:hypothetical protein